MSEHTQTRAKAAPAAKASAAQAGLLQRKCACGGKAGLMGECEECQSGRLTGLQTKLAVGRPGDGLEDEADRLADRVMRMPAPATTPRGQAPHAVQRQAVTPIGHAAGGAAFDAPPALRETLDSPGQPLDAQTRSFMESRFGHDFSRVRVHTDARAAESARSVNALAYTVGHNVVFAEGTYAPQTSDGRRLLAHELTHVLQQSGGPGRAPAQRLMRQACSHDGKDTGCGPNIGFIKFPDSSLHLDDTVVKEGLEKDLGGKWLTQVTSPKNPEKSGEESGRIDGVRVVSSDENLSVEVVEVKPRSTGGLLAGKATGGCSLATKEAKAYVAELKKLAPKIKAFPEKFIAAGFKGGFRIMDIKGKGRHAPKNKEERAVFEKSGININDKEWLDAWRFYNSLQQKIPKVFKKPFSSVNIAVYGGGAKGQKYRAFGWLIKCNDNSPGEEHLTYMVNQEGGVSYGCEKHCGRKKPKEERQVREVEKPEEVNKPVEQPVQAPVSVVPEVEVFNLFRDLFVWRTLPTLPPDSLVVFGVPEKLFDSYVGLIKVTNTLEHLKVRLTPALFVRLEGAVILLVSAVTGVAAASIAIPAALPAAGAVAAAAPAAAAPTTVASTPAMVMIGRFLTTAAANDNAIKVARAAGVLISIAGASAAGVANAEEANTSLFKELLDDNPAVLAVGNATGMPQLDAPGARFIAGNGKVYKVFAVARS